MKFKIEPLKADKYFVCSIDVEVVLKRKDLWTYVETPLASAVMSRTIGGGLTNDHVGEVNMARSPHDAVNKCRKETHERDSALVYILTSIGKSSKAMVRKVGYQAEA